MNILKFLQEVDRRFLYALVIITICLPFFVKIKIPLKTSPPVQSYYNKVEALQPGDFVLLAVDWSGGTRGENRPQTEATIRHLMRRKARFALLTFDPQARQINQTLATQLTQEGGYVYGKDWVNWGYRVDAQNYLKAFVQDIPGTIGKDLNGAPVADMEVMKGVRTAKDVKLLISVTPSAIFQTYIQFVQGPSNMDMILAPTAVMAAEAFNYLDSGQIDGMLTGLQGAAEYEQLLGVVGKATSSSIALSSAHLLIILFIVLGNVAMVLDRRRQRLITEG